MNRWWYAAPLLASLLSCNIWPKPTPSPSPTVTPAPTPVPTPVSTPSPVSCLVPASDDPLWGTPVDPGVRPSKLYGEYQLAVAKAGTTCGLPMDQGLELIAAQWRDLGRCAQRWADAVGVWADDHYLEEWHAIYSANGCAVTGQGAFKAAWPYGGSTPGPTPVPTPNPTPTPGPAPVGCGDPVPPRTYPDGATHVAMGLKPYGRWCDSTPQVIGAYDYCKQVGYTDGRSKCAVRQDGAPDLLACNAYVMAGQYPLFVPDAGKVVVNEDNPYMARCDGSTPCTKIQACTNDLLACSDPDKPCAGK